MPSVQSDQKKLTDQHCPNGNEDEQPQVCTFLQRKNQRVDMVGQTLRPSIQRMKRITGERRRYCPFMVWFVKPAVKERVMQATMDPINPAICEANEQWILQQGVSEERGLAGEII